uniref:non-specific serine/threonine protein kinase n=1 Tax=Macrostomum lignano TaxID=282301 RepID=A0A1I8GKE7_9PLAT
MSLEYNLPNEGPNVDPDSTADTLCRLAQKGDHTQLLRRITFDNCGAQRLSDGLTPLICAANATRRPTESHSICAELILQKAENPEARNNLANARDLSGQSCLHHAAASDNVQVLEAALRAGAQVNALDKSGHSALYMAVQRVNRNAANLLLKAGADQSHGGGEGQSPAELLANQEAEVQKLREAFKGPESIHKFFNREERSAELLIPLLQSVMERQSTDVSSERLLKLVVDKINETKYILKRWLPNPITADFKEVSKRRRKSFASGNYCNMYTTEMEPPGLPVVVRVLKNVKNTEIFKQEKRGLEALKKTKHRNIVQFLSANVSEREFEIFLEKIEGKTMKQHLEIASALCYLHNHPFGPIIHKDIRCENFMLTYGGFVKLIDFGFALLSGSMWPEEPLSGDPGHMAPELSGNRTYTPSSDIWATGCVLYDMSMGTDPSVKSAPDDADLDAIQLNLRSFRFLRKLPVPQIQPAEKFSQELLNLHQQCMETEPARRINAIGILLHPFLTNVDSQNTIDLSDPSCLHHAAASDNVQVLEAALRAGAQVNALDRSGHTALYMAVQRGNRNAANLLLKAGADQSLNQRFFGREGPSPAELLANQEAEVQKLRGAFKGPESIHEFVNREERRAGLLTPLLQSVAERQSTDVSSERLLELVEDKVDEVKLLFERWLPNPITTSFEEVSKTKRKSLAKGNFCDFYETETKPPNLPIVVRVLRDFNNKRIFELEKRGLEALKKTKHVNIIQLLKVHDSRNEIEMFLEKIEGQTLQQRLEKTGPFSEINIRRYFRQIASALCYLHNHPHGPIMHRDIRCENIIIIHNGFVKLINFGFAMPSGSISMSNDELAEFLGYMAPEVILEDKKYGRSSDVWAAGCVLYAMSMGRSPYSYSEPDGAGSNTSQERLANLIDRLYGPVAEIQPAENFSPELLDLCRQCMEKNTARRINATGMLLHPFLSNGESQILLRTEIHSWIEDVPSVIEALSVLVNSINKSDKDKKTAKVSGTSVAVGGGVVAIVGFALLIPSLGAALPVALAGTGAAIAGSTTAAGAEIIGGAVQTNGVCKAQSLIVEFRNTTERLLRDQLESICSSVQIQLMNRQSVIDLERARIKILQLKADVDEMIYQLQSLGILEALEAETKETSSFEKFISKIRELTKAKKTRNPVVELLAKIIEPINVLLANLDDDLGAMQRGRSVNEESSTRFNQELQKSIGFFSSMLRILLFGSSKDEFHMYVDEIKFGLRAATGGAQISLEATGIAASLAGRILGVVGSAVFTAVDIGFLVKYSADLHRARQGEAAEKAQPIICYKEIYEKLREEAMTQLAEN